MKNLLTSKAALCCIVLCGFFAVMSCQQAAEKQGEKMMENALEQATGTNTDVDVEENKITIESDSLTAVIETGAKSWPEGLPGDVPLFTWGTIAHTTTSEVGETKTWGVHFEGVTMEALNKYDAALKKAGFKTMKFTADKGGNVTGEKGKVIVTATVAEGNAHVAIQQHP